MVWQLTQGMAVQKIDVGMWRGGCYIPAEVFVILTKEGSCTIAQLNNGDDDLTKTLGDIDIHGSAKKELSSAGQDGQEVNDVGGRWVFEGEVIAF